MEILFDLMESDKQIIIGIAGVPGSGKTYYCQNILLKKFPKCKIIPMDGYHIYRKNLDEYGLQRRGAAFTFNFLKFKEDLLRLKLTGEGIFPSFNHAEKDPLENQIQISKDDKIILVEGLYLFLKEWNLDQIFDHKFFIDKPFDADLVGKRHFECGIESTLEKGIERAKTNDKCNAEYILQNSDFVNVTLLK